MKDYIIYDANGIIIRTGRCDENIINQLFVEVGCTILEGIADINTQYIGSNNEIISLTPTELAEKNTYKYGYIWDKVTRTLVKIATDDEINIYLADKERTKRNALLLACDWTQTADQNESTKLKWQPYRQALRNITDQPEFPQNIIWPVKPT